MGYILLVRLRGSRYVVCYVDPSLDLELNEGLPWMELLDMLVMDQSSKIKLSHSSQKDSSHY